MERPRPLSDLLSEAHRRATREAPLPDWHPVTGGIAGAAVFVVPMIIAASASVGVSLWALLLNAAVGFALPFFWLKRRRDAYDRAFERELEAIKASESSR